VDGGLRGQAHGFQVAVDQPLQGQLRRHPRPERAGGHQAGGLVAQREGVPPIPGTSSVRHLEDNMRGAGITLTAEEFGELSAIA
jgi:aryl-alcohol dehydrogenase-like predicted oxidoreductase